MQNEIKETQRKLISARQNWAKAQKSFNATGKTYFLQRMGLLEDLIIELATRLEDEYGVLSI